MERTESFGLRNTFQQARQSEFIKLKSGMLNTVEVYYSANYLLLIRFKKLLNAEADTLLSVED